MKKLITVSLMLLITIGAMAQVKFGIKAGANLANVAQNFKNPEDESKTKPMIGFHVGVVAKKELSEAIDFSTGLIYSQKGYSEDLLDGIDDGTFVDGYDRTIINYLEVPLNIQYKIGGLRIMAGPYFAFGVSGKNKYDVNITTVGGGFSFSESGEFEYKFKNKLGESELNDDNLYLRPLDYGVNLGLGYDMSGLVISANYGLGLSNLNPNIDVSGIDSNPDDAKLSNRVVSISLAYYFSK